MKSEKDNYERGISEKRQFWAGRIENINSEKEELKKDKSENDNSEKGKFWKGRIWTKTTPKREKLEKDRSEKAIYEQRTIPIKKNKDKSEQEHLKKDNVGKEESAKRQFW